MEIKTTRFELDGVKYARNEDTGYCIKSDGNKHARIGAAEFNEAYQAHLDAEDAAIREAVERVMQEEEDAEIARIQEEMAEPEEATIEDVKKAMNKLNKEFCKKTAKASRKNKVQTGGMEISEDGLSIVITAKQVAFIKELPRSEFWTCGVDSRLWIDCLCDELSDKMGPMTVGAMVSTLREKHLLEVGVAQFGGGIDGKGRKSKYMVFTETGKKVAARVLGL